MRANTHVTLVVDNTAPQTQRSKCATSPQPFLTDQHPIYGGKAEVVRTQQSGGYWHYLIGPQSPRIVPVTAQRYQQY